MSRLNARPPVPKVKLPPPNAPPPPPPNAPPPNAPPPPPPNAPAHNIPALIKKMGEGAKLTNAENAELVKMGLKISNTNAKNIVTNTLKTIEEPK